MARGINWTEEQLAAYLARNRRAPVPTPHVESDNPPAGSRPNETHKVYPRFSLTVHHRSRRLADATGRSHKAAVDGLVRGGILPDDSPKYLSEIRETFEKSQNEETVIEIWQE